MGTPAIRSVTLVALLTFTGVACGEATSPPAASGPSTSAPGSESTAPELLDFEAPLLGGGTFRGQDLAGKDVAFWFWAPW